MVGGLGLWKPRVGSMFFESCPGPAGPPEVNAARFFSGSLVIVDENPVPVYHILVPEQDFKESGHMEKYSQTRHR